jgi:hypothetical protein
MPNEEVNDHKCTVGLVLVSSIDNIKNLCNWNPVEALDLAIYGLETVIKSGTESATQEITYILTSRASAKFLDWECI